VSAAAARVFTVSDEETFHALRPEWNALLARSASDGPFLTWEWLATWWSHLRGRATLSVRCVRRRNGRLVGAAPLAAFPADPRRPTPWPALGFLGTGVAGSDYLDVIAREDAEGEVLDALAEALAYERRPVDLGQMRRAPCLAAGLAERLRAKGWTLKSTRSSICPIADLTGLDWDAYLARLGREHRYAVRRASRSLAARFTVDFETVEDERARRAAMEILARLHETRWRHERSDTAFCTPALVAFHDEASRRFLERGALRLYVLRVDGRPVAALYGFVHGRRFHFYQSGFDPEFASWSVGLAAMAGSIRAAIQEGARVYDFLHGAERYKFHWAGRLARLRRIEMYPPGGRGWAAMRVNAIARGARRAVRRTLAAVAS
jgi:CelD/BcsL family acetyltransferase involved in cellulose biosynthesis